MAKGYLTQDRTTSSGYTAQQLNDIYDQAIAAAIASLPNGVTQNGYDMNLADLYETDEIAAGIETPADIMAAIAYIGMTYNASPDTEYGGVYNTDFAWIFEDRFEYVDEVPSSTPEYALSVYDYIENQYASGAGLNVLELGAPVPPREYVQQWLDEVTRFEILLKDQAMFLGNQYVQNGAVYNTARIGDSITLTQALRNANNQNSAAIANSVNSGQLANLSVVTKLLPMQTQQEVMLTSGGGNPQSIPALSGGNASPFVSLRGFSPTLRNSLNGAQIASKMQPLSNTGNQQQFSFNTGPSTTPVYQLFIGQDSRDLIGEIAITVALPASGAGVKITNIQQYSNDTALGGYKGTVLSLEDFQAADWATYAGTTVSFESFDEFSKDRDTSFWGYPDPVEVSFENFGVGFPQGARSLLDRPLDCSGSGSSGEAGGQIFSENITSQVDGVRTNFTVSTSYVSNSLRLYRNGQRMGTDQVVETGRSTFSTTFTASAGEVLIIDYIPRSS